MTRFLAALLPLFATGACAAPACPVDDAYAAFVQVAQRTADASDAERLAVFHRDFLAQNAALYTPSAIGLEPGAALDDAALRGLAGAAGDPRATAFDLALAGALAATTARFAQALPEFRCDFPIYIAPTFGKMDGAGRVVAGKPALVLGPDVIARFETEAQLPVFLAHELFHRHHFAMAGFSDDLAERDLVWRTLWAEGLATYASARLNPERPLADALLLPRDLEARAAPLVPALARELAPELDRVDAQVFGRFFGYGDAQARSLGWPYRSGYYLGYLVAQRLGEHRTLAELARLQGPELRREIGAAVDGLRGTTAAGR